jgi:hypothetical protein
MQQCQALARSIFFLFHPISDVRRTILKLHAIRLATPQKLHCVAIRQPHFSQIQNDVSVVRIEEPLQVGDVLSIRPISAKTVNLCRRDLSILKVIDCSVRPRCQHGVAVLAITATEAIKMQHSGHMQCAEE